MNTVEDREFDYQAYMRENPPDASKIRSGTEARKERRKAAKMRNTVHVEQGTLEQFRQIAPKEYERLINQVLQEWLTDRQTRSFAKSTRREAEAGIQNVRAAGQAIS